jgi:hypothetical protein
MKMSNSIKTLTAGDITRKALSILHSELVFTKTINRDYDDRFARSGAKNGGYLEIRDPNQFTVRTGQVMDTQDVEETVQELVLATQMGVDVNFSSVELTLSLDDFAERILTPAMSRLAAEVDKTNISAIYPWVAQTYYTTPTAAPGLIDIRGARARLNQGLAPSGNRILMMDSLGANSVMSVGQAFVQPGTAIARQYERGLIGDLYGFKFYESETTPVHTRGGVADATPTCDITAATTAIVNGRAIIKLTAILTTSTIAKGDVFNITGLYAVNPETKQRYAHLMAFSVTTAIADTTVDATSVGVSPTPYLTGAKQNCEVVTSSSTAAVFFATGSTAGLTYTATTASTVRTNALAYHKDFATAVFADLEMPKGVDFSAREVFDGISLRIVRQYDVVNDKFPCRIDVLFGQKCIRPGWACRIIG